MPRKNFFCDPLTPYHLTARSNNRESFPICSQQMWEVFSSYLFFIHHAYAVKIHSFVLMKNHFHLIASFPEANLSESMGYFMRETSKVTATYSNRINHIYGTRIFRSRLGSYHYYLNAYKYVFQNPVRALNCDKVEQYPFSTLSATLGQTHSIIPLVEDSLLIDDPEQTLRWINTKISKENLQAIQSGLKKFDFKLPRCSKTNRAHSLETSLI